MLWRLVKATQAAGGKLAVAGALRSVKVLQELPQLWRARRVIWTRWQGLAHVWRTPELTGIAVGGPTLLKLAARGHGVQQQGKREGGAQQRW
ncbi:hypothetical protein NL676_033901 [Syzygium grande]|nr:hypothetical protein NL676_033901 [Syzygium grande]